VEPTHLQVSLYTHLLYKAQDPFSHEDSPGSETSSHFVPFFVGPSLCFIDQETQEEIFGGTSSLEGQFLHPSPVRSPRSIQPMKTVLAPTQVLIFHLFFMGPSLGLTDHETQEDILLDGTNPFTGEFFYPRYLLYYAQLIHSALVVQRLIEFSINCDYDHSVRFTIL